MQVVALTGQHKTLQVLNVVHASAGRGSGGNVGVIGVAIRWTVRSIILL